MWQRFPVTLGINQNTKTKQPFFPYVQTHIGVIFSKTIINWGLLKNRSCKRLRQKEEVVTAPKENLSFEEALMLERINHVKNVCQEIESASNDFCSFKSKYHDDDQAISGRNHIQDPNTGTIYCFNHKVASSTWMSFFARMQSRTRQFQHIIETEKYYKVKDFLQVNDLTVMDKDNTAFIIVRHPLDRLISAFTDRILNKQTDQVRSK